MSTYDGAYQDRRISDLPDWAKPCTCDDEKVSPLCVHHGIGFENWLKAIEKHKR
jgi:hypothetical protein